MAAEILITVRPFETRVAYVDNGVLTDLKIERKGAKTLVGSVYKGKVNRVLPGMQAAFVDIGLERSGFLYVGDIRPEISPEQTSILRLDGDDGDENGKDREAALVEGASESESSSPRTPIQDLVKEGQHLMVQVAKDPLGTKGARLTNHISLPGRFLVYMPTLNHIGVSRRIEDEEKRDQLRQMIEALSPNGGVIVRTAAEAANEGQVRADLESMDKLYKEITRHYRKRKSPGLLHVEMDVELRALRDLLSEDVEKIYVDDRDAFRKIQKFINQVLPKYKNRLVYYDEREPLFDRHEVELEISRSLNRKIWLKSGGYIVVDEAEALVVIDVNTGRYVGKKDLEDTILKTNLEAAKEIAYQLRIRNCGGIIIIDFIDMEKKSHRDKVMSLLEEELRLDRAKTNLFEMSELGLVQMTRKRIRPSLVKSLCEPCAYCEGRGYVKQRSTIAYEIFRDLEREAVYASARSGKGQLIVKCHAAVVDWIYEVEEATLAKIEKKTGASVSFRVDPDFHIEQYDISKGR